MRVSIRIECIRGGLKGQSWNFDNQKQIIKIGRYKNCDIVIPKEDTTVSRQQCEIRINNGKVILIDGDGERGSTHGTWIDDGKIPQGKEGYCLERECQLGIGEAGGREIFKVSIQKESDNTNGQKESVYAATVDATVEVEHKEIIVESVEKQKKGEEKEKKEEKKQTDSIAGKKQEKVQTKKQEKRITPKKNISTLEEAYTLLDTLMQEADNGKQNMYKEEYIQKREKERKSYRKKSLEEAYTELDSYIKNEDSVISSSIVINIDDYEDNIEQNSDVKIDDLVVIDKEEKEIEHHVKLTKIDIGWNGTYKKKGGEKKGGFGSVIEVQNKQTKQRFALKELRKKDPNSIKWFKREVLTGQQLDHPNLLHVYEGEFNDKEKIYKYLMEYCEGGDLASYIKKKKNIRLEDAVIIMYQILDGLDYLHNAEVICFDGDGKAKKIHGLVHRDIKPGNIFLKKQDDISSIAIGDYGTLKSVELTGESDGTNNGIGMGQDGYKPIKLVERKGGYRFAKPGVDVFSAAAIFYFLLTGDTIKRGKDKMVIPIREKNKNIPLKLAKAIDYVLKEDDIIDEELVTTAKQFKDTIKEAMESE